MKAFIIAALSFISTSAFAMPAVGDSATYSILTQGMTIIQKVELTAFDSSRNSFTQVETTTMQGQTKREITTVAFDELISDETADMILAYCESQMGGTLQNITVTAGSFLTCSVYDPASGTQINMGRVPFGMIKLQGSNVSAQLIDFKNGK